MPEKSLEIKDSCHAVYILDRLAGVLFICSFYTFEERDGELTAFVTAELLLAAGNKHVQNIAHRSRRPGIEITIHRQTCTFEVLFRKRLFCFHDKIDL